MTKEIKNREWNSSLITDCIGRTEIDIKKCWWGYKDEGGEYCFKEEENKTHGLSVF